MSNDNFTEVTNQSWFSRLGGALKGIIVGLILIVISFPLLFWNEGRAVKRYKTLTEGSGLVVTVPSDTVNPEYEGKLVHTTGTAENPGTLEDDMFGIVVDNAIKIKRTAEMYQWKETSKSKKEKKVGGGTKTTTTYSYSKTWSSSLINSSSFNKPEGHENPSEMTYSSRDIVSDNVELGAFKLTASMAGSINNYTSFVFPQTEDGTWGELQISNNYLYSGNNPSSPEIGDTRVSFKVVNSTDVSLVARQIGNTFEPYQTRAGGTIELLSTGIKSAEAMFEDAQTSNVILTWVLRVVGFLLMFIGFRMLLGVFSVIADVLPILGNIVSAGTGIISFLIALVLSSLTIAIAWITFRPLLGISLLVVVIGGTILIRSKLKKA